MISKQEYIALREREAAYCAILFALQKANFTNEIIDTKKVRSIVQDVTGFPFSELAIGKALNAPKPFAIAVQVAGTNDIGTYKIDKKAVRRNYETLALSQGSLVWQLENVGHDQFRSMVTKLRKDASERYKIDKNYDNPVVAEWADINIRMLDGLFQRAMGERAAPKETAKRMLFFRGAFKPEWVSVYVGIIAIIIAVWIG